MNRLLSVLEEKTTIAGGMHRCRQTSFDFFKISVWDLFCIPQADYLALDKTEKSRMLNEYHSKLVAQYFGDGKNSLFFVWKLSEKKSVLAFVSYFPFLLSDLLLFYGIFFR